jgi:hypothetical protein
MIVADDERRPAIGDPIRRRALDLLLAEGFGTPTGLSDRRWRPVDVARDETGV